MNIVQVCPYDIDRPGGVQRHIRDTAAALCERGHLVTIIAPRTGTPPLEPPPGVMIHRLGRAWRIGFSGTRFEISLALGRDRRRLGALMRESDLAHFHTVWTPLLALQALRAFSGPAVATFHDTPPQGFGGRLLQRLFRLFSRILLPRFAAVLVPSPAPLAHLVAAGTQELTVFPPCTDLRPFAGSAPQPGFADGRINILFLGRLEKRKGAALLLEAFALLANDNLRLIIAGAGPQEAALKDRAGALRHVVFAGAVAGTAPWFAACDIFCAPSPYGESFGIVLAEAMAAGKPVVAAANAGYRTLLTGEAARLLVAPGDAAGLAAALAALAGDEGLRKRLGAWGRANAPRYDCRALAPELEEIFRQAIVTHRLKARNAI